MNFMDISKLIMNGEKLFNISLRVCFYARVSTDTDMQLSSLENQLNYYEKYIKEKEKWTFVCGYVDEGISGVSVEKREGFKRMIEDAKLHKFDLIITKEVSRFARDMEDSIHYIRLLRDTNVGVFFENQNLNTFDNNSELILNIMFNLAQEESRKLSSRIKFGHREAIRKGHVLGSSNIIGYKKNNCKLVIVEEEAKFIRKVYELYSSGNYGLYKLSMKLGQLGFYNKNGNLYDKDTLKRIISNPKYKGFYRARTYEVIDYRTKKRKKNNIDNQIIYKSLDGSIPMIVSEELWDKANAILNRRAADYCCSNHFSSGVKYPFSSKIHCLNHNTCFQRSHGLKKTPVWTCSLYLQHSLAACSSPIIAENDLYNICKDIMNSVICDKKMIINNMINLYKRIDNTSMYDSELNSIDEQIKKIEKKKTFFLDLVFNGDLKKDSLKEQFINFENRLDILNSKREELLRNKKIITDEFNINKVYKSIDDFLNGEIVDDFIRKFIEGIRVSKINNDRCNILLDIYLNLDDKKILKKDCYDKFNILLDNKKYSSMNRRKNNYIYNVYI